MVHPDQDRLLGFLAGRCTQEQAQDVFMHVAECSGCAQRVQALRSLRADPSRAWGGFLEQTMHRRHEAPPEPASERMIDLARGLVSAARKLATLAVSTLRERPDSRRISVFPTASYQGVGDAGASERAYRLLRQAADHCSRGEDEKALTALGAAARIDAVATSSASLDLRSEGRLAGRVIVDASRRTVAVLVYPDVLPCSTCVAQLRTLGAEDPLTQDTVMAPVEGATYLLAEFHEIPDGPFTVSISST